MKKIFSVLALTLTIVLTSCQGDPGPPGPQGLDGINILGNVFETTVDFTANNGYETIINIPSSIEVFESDVVLVYLLENVVPDGQGGTADEWSQLPQIFFPPQGTLTYNFAHTFFDVRLFLDANFDLNSLGNEFTNDQTFRIAVLPAEFADVNITMEELIETLSLSQNNITKIP